METSLHRELKRLYAGPEGRTEVRTGKFRVDAMIADGNGVELIEIQHGPLWAIRDKIQKLAKRHRVKVVKPIIGRKRLIRCGQLGGPILSRRNSPSHGRLLDVFDELVYFTRVFPHRNLSMEVVLVDIEERRLPPPVRSRGQRHGWRRKYVIEDQILIEIREAVRLAQPADLKQLIDCALPIPFHTGELAAALDVERWTAQRIAYVLRKVGAATVLGKRCGAWLYDWCKPDHGRRAA